MKHLLAVVEGLRDVATAHAAESERLRTLAPAVVKALRASGLFAFGAPAAVGGGEHGPLAQLEVIEALTRIDTASGWSLMISALLSSVAGAYLPDAGAREVFARGVPICAGMLMPSGVLQPAPGGYRASGRWAFGSGIRHAEWIVTSAVVQSAAGAPAEGAPEMRTIVVPVAEVEIEDTWHAAGLRGSGSEHYRLADVFVPEARTCRFPAAAAQRGGHNFDLPLMALLAPVHAAFPLGAARSALDQIAALAPKRTKAWPGIALADHSAFQMELGRADVKLRAAQSFAREAFGQLEARMQARQALTGEDWRCTRTAVSHATDVAAEVTSFAFRSGGAAALYQDNPLQRSFRDVFAATQHIAATDDAYEFSGKVLLGVVSPHPLLAARAVRSV